MTVSTATLTEMTKSEQLSQSQKLAPSSPTRTRFARQNSNQSERVIIKGVEPLRRAKTEVDSASANATNLSDSEDEKEWKM